MTIFLSAFLTVDAAILLSAHFANVTEAAKVCYAMAPLCSYPAPMFVLGVIASGLLVLQRS